MFLRNLLLNENHPLHNRTLHISGLFKRSEKADIEHQKADIKKKFNPKTTGHILKLREEFSDDAIFGRPDVMQIIDIKSSRASDFLNEMAEHEIIEPFTGRGKGKYKFKI